MSDGKQEKNASFKAIFEDEDEVYAESFRDRVRAIHEHFDRDQDGYLNYQELSDLQQATSGSPLADGDQYVMICRTLECKPNQGISVEALRLTYASDGTNLGKTEERHVWFLQNPSSPSSRFALGPFVQRTITSRSFPTRNDTRRKRRRRHRDQKKVKANKSTKLARTA